MFDFSESCRWISVVLFLLLILLLILSSSRHYRQKTRSPQQRRVYVGTVPRRSLGASEPTIYVSPSNLPPPPKYEYMAPPSYEEVVGVHYPQFAAQPITQPISTALAQAQGPSQPENVTLTVANERRTSLPVART